MRISVLIMNRGSLIFSSNLVVRWFEINDSCHNCEMLTTFSICGACFLMVISTPLFSVIWFMEQPTQAPCSCTFTTFPSSMEISEISPPSFCKNGLISLKASSTFIVNSSVVILFFYGAATCHCGYFYCFGGRKVFVSANGFFHNISCNCFKSILNFCSSLQCRGPSGIARFAYALHQRNFT